MTRTEYVVQESTDKGEWEDSFTYLTLTKERAIALYRRYSGDPIWRYEGRRKWRVVERVVTDTVIETD